MYNETDYLQSKQMLIQQLAHAKKGEIREGMRLLSAQATIFFNSDLDIAWIRVVLATNNFTRKMSLKKAKRIMSVLEGKNSIGNGDFANRCNVKATEYLTECAHRDKGVKKRALVWSAICIVLIAAFVVGSIFVDRSGILYGTEDLVFSSADGKTITARNAVKYNDHVHLSLPTKSGYKATGVYDTKTGKQMFDANGVSLSTVQSRSLDDYSDCELVVQYEPKVYAASIATTAGLALSSFEYTVETVPEDVIDEPQELPGYVFEDWYTDNKFRNRFTGSFSDYADLDKPLILYAHYVLDGWTITWDLCGGTLKGDSIDNYTILSDVVLPDETIVTRTGYHLAGWLLDGKKIDYFTPTQMKDVTIVAQWTPNRYAITYSLCGGELDDPIVAYTIEDAVEFHSPYRLGYDFVGWYTSRAYQTPIDGIERGTIGDMTVFARWTPKVYALNYILDGGSFGGTIPTSYTIEDEVTLSVPSRNGYSFVGWYVMPSNETRITSISAGTTSGTTICAHWTPIEYKLTYVLNGGEFDGDVVQSYTVEDELVLDTPRRVGYRFGGWYTSPSYDEAIVTLNQGQTSNTIVYAKWNVVSYTLSVQLDGGILEQQLPSCVTIEDTISLPLPYKRGYTFTGWIDSTNQIVQELSHIESNQTIIATWSIDNYSITYAVNGGEIDENAITKYTVRDEVQLPPIKRIGYDFDGWYTSRLYVEQASDISIGTVGDLTFYAKWTPIEYHIDYELNGGTNSLYNPAAFTVDSPRILYPATREGYSFNGWYNDVACENAITCIENTAGNITVYADWTPNTYQVNIVPTVGNSYTVSVQYDGYYKLDEPEIEGYTFQKFVVTTTQSEFAAQGIFHQANDIVLTAQYSANKYNISYYDGNTLLTKQEVCYGEQISYLVPDAQSNREFVAWYHDKYLVEQAEEKSYQRTRDISLYAYFLSTTTINLAANTKYEIGPQIDKAYFVGTYRDGDSLLENVQIIIACRDTALTLYFDHVGISAKANKTAIQFENASYELSIVVISNSYVKGGNGSDGTSSDLDAKSGKPAFSYDGNVSLKAVRSDSTMTFVGGNGGKGHNGADGSNGSAGVVGWDAAGKEGGNGSNGANGGKGGDGAVALACNKLYVNSNFTLNLVGGNAGSGGAGGAGGRGGSGGYANNQGWYDNVIVDPGRIHGVNGGSGGNGGNGGSAGVKASAVSGNVVCNNTGATVNKQSGQSADGGAGGNAGSGGDAGKCKYIRCIIIACWCEDKNGSRGSDGIKGNNG